MANRKLDEEGTPPRRAVPSRRGFASMDEKTQREIASRGGRAAQERGTAHEFDSAEAREAGRRGGRVVSQNRAHMAAIGREGGRSRWRNYNDAEPKTPAKVPEESDSKSQPQSE